MLIRLLRRYLAPYWMFLLIIVAMHTVATMAALYLPSLNADLIDSGVAQGDTGYIMRTGGVMLVVAYLLCGVTQSMFAHQITVSTYATLVGVLAGLSLVTASARYRPQDGQRQAGQRQSGRRQPVQG